MAFTVEDGSAKVDANSYCTVEFADSYHTDRSHTGWTGSSGVKQAALIRATDYVDKRWGNLFRGYRKTKEQALQWPRLGAYDNAGYAYTNPDDVPRKLRQAVAEYALRALTEAQLAPDPSEASVGEMVLKREKVGPIEEETQYSAESASRSGLSGLVSAVSIPEYPEADLLMAELINSTSSRMMVRG